MLVSFFTFLLLAPFANGNLFNDTNFTMSTETPTTTATQTCGDTSDCEITCSSSTNPCKSNVIFCPSTSNFAYKCLITCTDDESCLNLVVYAQNSINLTLLCQGQDSCSNARIFGPQTTHDASLSAYESSFYLDASNHYAATNIEINASFTDYILINCLGTSSCDTMSLYATNAKNLTMDGSQIDSFSNILIDGSHISNYFEMECSSTQSCNNQIIFLNESTCNILINCQSSTSACDDNIWFITANSGNYAEFICKSCARTIIDAREKQVGSIDLKCSNSDGCKFLELYISSTFGSISDGVSDYDEESYYVLITCSTNTACAALEIYSEDGFRYDNNSIGLEFSCKNIEACSNITLFCGTDYEYSCNIEYDDEYLTLFPSNDVQNDGFICVASDAASYGNCGQTYLPTMAPTDPTMRPTRTPTGPTPSPSNNPTSYPTTHGPTMAPVPTQSPTPAPTKKPTKDNNDDEDSSSTIDLDIGAYVGIFVGCFIFCAICLIACCLGVARAENKRKDRIQQEREEKERRVVEGIIAQGGAVPIAGGHINGGVTGAPVGAVGAVGAAGVGGTGSYGSNESAPSGEVEMGAVQVVSNVPAQFAASPAVVGYQMKKEREEQRKAMGIEDNNDKDENGNGNGKKKEEDDLPQYKEAKKDGYGLVGDDDEVDDVDIDEN